MKPIDVIAVKNAVANGWLAAELNPNGSILLKDPRSGEAVIIGTTRHLPTKHKKPLPTSMEEEAKWKTWGGWAGNHDQRIEGATCTKCGYEHPTVYGSLKRLGTHCPGCGRKMTGVVEY